METEALSGLSLGHTIIPPTPGLGAVTTGNGTSGHPPPSPTFLTCLQGLNGNSKLGLSVATYTAGGFPVRKMSQLFNGKVDGGRFPDLWNIWHWPPRSLQPQPLPGDKYVTSHLWGYGFALGTPVPCHLRHPSINTPIIHPPCTHSFTDPFTHPTTHPHIYPSFHIPSTHSSTIHSFIHPNNHSPIHPSTTHSLTI